jgi:N-acetylmuramoyl-L-alanine amidase
MKVCVDPGHGMGNATAGTFDPGAVHNGSNTREADVMLRYGLELKQVLEARGVEVFMTRENNTAPTPVGKRAPRAETANCDMFVSLHMNSFSNGTVKGIEVLFRDDPDKQLADDMQAALLTATGLSKRPNKKRADLAVLTFDGPAVLLELISNTTDRGTIIKPAIQTAVCKAIADVVQAA